MINYGKFLLILFLITSITFLSPILSQDEEYKIIENPKDCSSNDIDFIYQCKETFEGHIKQGESISCNVTIHSKNNLKFYVLTRPYFTVKYKRPGSNTWEKISEDRIGPFATEAYYKINCNYGQEIGVPLYFLDELGLWKIKFSIDCVDTSGGKSKEVFFKEFNINVITPETYSELKAAKDQLEFMKKKKIEDRFINLSVAFLGAIVGGIATFLASFILQKIEWKKRLKFDYLNKL